MVSKKNNKEKATIILDDEFVVKRQRASFEDEKRAQIERATKAKNTYTEPVDFVSLPIDENIHKEAHALYKKMNVSMAKELIVVGIGGSIMGFWAIVEGLSFERSDKKTPRVTIVDAPDTEKIDYIKKEILPKTKKTSDVLIVIISKSGSTLETQASGQMVYDVFEKKYSNGIHKQCVLITEEGSSLWNMGIKKGMNLLAIPKVITGRFSVFSQVGLFPLLCAGVDIEALCAGAQSALSKSMIAKAQQSARLLYEQYIHGKTAHAIFVFHEALTRWGQWYRQILAESINKEGDELMFKKHTGITPLLLTGPRDLHALVPLLLDGPRKIFTLFVQVPQRGTNTVIKRTPLFTKKIKEKTAQEITSLLIRSITKAYDLKHLPSTTIKLPHLSAFWLGWLMEYKMIETVFLGDYLNVDVFTQPAVDEYKRFIEAL